jgi:prepilin-type N-terminal cleavage/methylation domain-containing protein
MKNGFTLIELLAVIVIISLLTVLTVIGLTSVVKNGKEELNEKQQVLIEKAAQIWATDNISLLPNNDNCIYLTLTNLIDEGYIDDDVYNINNMSKLDSNTVLIRIDAIINNSGKLVYNYIVNPDSVNTCDEIE